LTYLCFLAFLPIHEVLNFQLGFTVKPFHWFLFITASLFAVYSVLCYIQKRKLPFRFSILDGLLLIFICSNVFSAILSNDIMGSVRLLVALSFMCLSYLLTTHLITTNARLNVALKVIAYSAFIASLFGLVQYIGFLLGFKTGLRFGFSWWFPRLHSTMQEPAFFANYLLIVLPILLSYWYDRNYNLFPVRRLFCLLGIIILALFFTLSKGTFAALAMLFPLLLLRKGIGFNFKRVRLFVILGGALLFVIGSWLMTKSQNKNSTFSAQYILTESFLNNKQGAYAQRREFNATAWKMILDNIWFGVGPYNYTNRYDEYKPNFAMLSGNVTRLIPNNLIMNLWAENGVFGLLSFLAILGYVFFQSFRLLWHLQPFSFEYSTALGLSYGFLAMNVQYLFSAYFYYPHYWVLLGLLVCTWRLYNHDNAAITLKCRNS